MSIKEQIKDRLPLTLGETIKVAEENEVSVVDIVLAEAQIQLDATEEEVLAGILEEFSHNLKAVEIGVTTGESLLFGTTGAQLKNIDGPSLFQDKFVDDAVMYTIAAQVGNHTVGLNPCAGTGDPCVYTGFIRAMYDNGYEEREIARIAALILKVGSMFRVGKISTGCNMEGFGAGVAAISAATVELLGGSPRDMERAMVLGISPTIAVPCTPRVMVPALCATHIGGAILIGHMAGGLAVKTSIEVNVPIDVMIAMATEIHPISAKEVVPVVVDYMKPFFKTDPKVEELVDEEIKAREEEATKHTLERAAEVSENLAKNARPITNTLGEAVVGGSSQGVGSPTNTGRIAHELFKEQDDVKNIKKLTIELYPELFARRGINVAGVTMGALFGASTADGDAYKHSLDEAKANGVEIEIVKVERSQAQNVTLESDKAKVRVEALNRGGGRLVLLDANPSKEEARLAAEKLGIVLVEE